MQAEAASAPALTPEIVIDVVGTRQEAEAEVAPAGIEQPLEQLAIELLELSARPDRDVAAAAGRRRCRHICSVSEPLQLAATAVVQTHGQALRATGAKSPADRSIATRIGGNSRGKLLSCAR